MFGSEIDGHKFGMCEATHVAEVRLFSSRGRFVLKRFGSQKVIQTALR